MSQRTIIVTRPQQEEEGLTQALHALGHLVINEPLTEIFLNHTVRQPLHQALMADPDAVIVTSKNGARALAALSELRDAMILCVGQSTADTAQSLGFVRVCMCGENVQALVNHIADAYDDTARFVYVCAQHVRIDLPETLAGFSMKTQPIVAYGALASPQLSDTLVEQIRRGKVDAFTFMSQRSAQIFMQLLAKAEIMDHVSSLDVFCLSEAVAEPLRGQAWRHIAVADNATLASLIHCVDNAY
jgi:uroporphyrinogen-III synthase